MKKLLTLFVIVLICGSCTKDEPTAPKGEDQIEEAIAEATFGQEGGTLKSDDFELTVPGGAFALQTTLKISLENEQPFGDNEVTQLYRIDGLPNNFQKPIRLAIKYSGSLSNKTYMAIGENGFVKSYGDTLTSYHLIEAYDSSGFLVSNIPAVKNISLNKSSGVESIIRTLGITNLFAYDTPAGHFGIIGRMDNTSLDQYQVLGAKLESAYDILTFKDFKFKRDKWPILVILKRITETSDGQPMIAYYKAAEMFDAHGYIVLDLDIFGDENINEIIGHELLHLAQDLYDPRDWNAKAKVAGGNHLWLDEATAVYSEEFFNDNPTSYIPSIFEPYCMSPFDGIHKEEFQAITHGYGLAAMIKFLSIKYPQAKLIDYYTHINNSIHPVKALINSTNEPKEWLEEFYREYMLGNVYNKGNEFWIENAHSKYSIDKVNKSRTLSNNYADISGRIYNIEIKHEDFSENKSLEFNIDGADLSHLTLFKYNNSSIEYLKNHTSRVISPKISSLKVDDSHLLALVTNQRAKSPYTDKIKLILTIEPKEIINITSCYIALRDLDVEYIRKFDGGGSETEFYTFSTGFFKGDNSTISFSNNTFTQSHDFKGSDGVHYTGFVELKFDSDINELLTFKAKSKMIYDHRYYGYTMETEVNGHNIEKTGSNEFTVFGLGTCSKLGSVSYYKQYSDYRYELQNIVGCNDSTEIEISIY